MRLKIIALILLLSTVVTAFSLTDIELFKSANELYTSQKYNEAITEYEKLLVKGYDNYNVNFNLGCSYYNINDVSLSRYYFEKAFLHSPFNKELINNLNLLYEKIYDDFYEDDLMFKRWFLFVNPFFVMIIFFVLAVIMFLFTVRYILKRNKSSLLTAVVVFLISIFVFIYAVFQYSVVNDKYGIIIRENAEIYLSPDSNTVISAAKYGDKLKISAGNADFFMISLSDSTTGWIDADCIKVIKY